MDAAFAWIGWIFEWLGKFFPRWAILDTTEGGVKFTGFMLPRALRVKCGGFDGEMRVTICGPGIHWYWPATTSWQTYPTARQADNLPTQMMVTSDGQVVAAGGMIVYSVEDLEKLLTTTHSAAKAVQDISLTAIHDVCGDLTWEELKMKQRKGTLNTALRNAVQKELKDYGVKVIKCMLTDLAPTRVYRLINSTQQDDI